MPELIEQMYCSQQIVIPPKFPYILKRYCKAAIKTQPYDLLRWSFEYFKALAERRPPPVKLRLEYPVYSTEGGLTRGCLKVLANQLAGQVILPLEAVKAAWQGFCLDPMELRRIFCLCEVFMRTETIPFLHFIAVAGGMLTKSLTHTMILLCETLTKEPDGGSAAICVHDFISMYRFLAVMDASKDVRYIDGYREGFEPPVYEETVEEEEEREQTPETDSEDEYWHMPRTELYNIQLVEDSIPNTNKLSSLHQLPLIGEIERSASTQKIIDKERDEYMRDWSVKPRQDEEVDRQLRQLSADIMGSLDEIKEEETKEEEPVEKEKFEILVFDEDGNLLPLEFYGEPEPEVEAEENEEEGTVDTKKSMAETKSAIQTKSATSTIKSKATVSEVAAENGDENVDEEVQEEQDSTEQSKIRRYVKTCYEEREERRENLLLTFDEIATLVDRFQTASYDLGMVAGRQMSITSGEFIVQHIEKEIMDFIDEQIATLPDPDLKKKKAKPDEVAMIREMLDHWLNESIDYIIPEIEEVEEEEEPIPEITLVYAVPGIGPPVDDDTIQDVIDYASDVCKVQADLFMPRNIRHFMCPPLEKYLEITYDDDSLTKKTKKEEVTSGGGIITD
ncbi:hypothetical protein O0L34_g19496 [Tuta absoluta]|nr:hypothetical protein O0L34_g19496 [Tuta absoluta]